MVSIVLVTYNRAEKLKLSIQDILNQTFKEFELIICDDCSPDHTQSICEGFAARDDRIRYIRNEKNLRMPENLNQGIRMAKYDYVAILHDAERFDPNLILLWYQALDKYKTAAFAFYQHTVIDDTGKIVHTNKQPFSGLVSGKYLLRNVFFRRWHFDSPVFGMVMGRKSLFEEIGMFKHEYGFYADVDMWMSLLHNWDAFYVEQPLIKSYVETHQFDDNMWKIGAMMQNMFIKHRKIEFANNFWFKRFYEIVIHYLYCYFVNLYNLLLTYKHHNYSNLIIAKKMIIENTILLLPIWFVVFIFWTTGRGLSLVETGKVKN
ncbi:glycosyltransferase family 2 protein [Nostoc sp.]|uniref:glycosyltransferase family 2 protein n=1 Tax=Nostoc sp. TaxID=1180 RepID=UPI002FF5F245